VVVEADKLEKKMRMAFMIENIAKGQFFRADISSKSSK